MLRYLFVLVAVLVTSTFAQFDTYRLPNNTRPETYDISIRTAIHENNATFTGTVRIGIVATESTNFIRLHHNVELIESVRVLSTAEVPIATGDLSYNAQYHFLTIPIVGILLPQGSRYFVEIDYVGFMNTYSGFYRSVYIENGTSMWFASTQFEATYARRAFPCYDELGLKSNFTIRITHSSTYSALSNMPIVSETPNPDGFVTTLFETTPVMSTYLVAFHISQFPHVTSSTPRPIPQRMYSSSIAIGLTNVTLESGEALIEAISDYVGIDYSLPKMDHIAVPNFPSGAMENWGLITYDEFYALYNESEDFYTRRLMAIQTVSHELAHQWFGNLVTPSWWTYLWMKEGFGTFFEYLGVDLIHPDWQMMNYFVVDVTQNIFFIDSSEFAQPMTHYVEHPLEIDFQFSSIAYQKAAAVLRMFWFMFGENTFMRGATAYLENNAYADAGEEELFEALDLSVWLEPEFIIPPTVDVPTIMASWTRQSGFPLISVERNYDRSDQVTLRQEIYYSYPSPNPRNTTWWVPYNLMTPSNPGANGTFRVDGWIPQNSSSWEITVDSLDADDYLLINKRAAGYYRVIYDERNYKLISDAMVQNIHDFHPTNIAQLIFDALEFYQTGRLNVTTILDLIRCLEFEGNYISWNPAFNFIFNINQNFRGHQNYPIWADFIRSLTEHLYNSVGVVDTPEERILNKMARESIVHLACLTGSVHCRSDATRQLRNYMETGEGFHLNIRQVLRCASMRSATRTDFNRVWDRLKSMSQGDFIGRSEIIDMLGCSHSRLLLNEYVSSTFNLTIWSQFEQYSVINSILQNGGNTGMSVMLEFFIENAAQTMQVFGDWFVQTLAYYVSNADHIERFIVYQNILIDAGLLSPEYFEFNMEIVAESVRWLNNEGEVINTWLLENVV